MTSTVSCVSVEDLPDAVLLDAVRVGDVAAFEVLVRRYDDSTRRAAAVHGADSVEPDDLAAEAFAWLFADLRQGGGPRTRCDLYLAAVIQRLARRLRDDPGVARYGHLTDLDELAECGVLSSMPPEVGADDIVVHRVNCETISVAFRALSKRWRQVLWALDVQRHPMVRLARRMGISENAVSSLATRAREGLRRAYLRTQIPIAHDRRCPGSRHVLPTYIRVGVKNRRAKLYVAHVEGCEHCRRVAHELIEANREFEFDPHLCGRLRELVGHPHA